MDLLDLLINKTVEIAVTNGLLRSKMVMVDATYTQARYNQKSPKELLQEKLKTVRKAVYQLEENMVGKFPEKPASTEIEEELQYCQQVIEVVETQSKVAQMHESDISLQTLRSSGLKRTLR